MNIPDTVVAGSFIKSDAVCICRNIVRSYVYGRMPYCPGDHSEKICPWCIADGSAARFLDCEFVAIEGINGDGKDWDDVSDEIKEEISKRTPGFPILQGDQWYTHCGDAAVFLGYIHKDGLIDRGQKVTREFIECLDKETYEEFLEWGGIELLDMIEGECGEAQGYFFKCIHCGKHGGFVDYM